MVIDVAVGGCPVIRSGCGYQDVAIGRSYVGRAGYRSLRCNGRKYEAI